MRLCRHGRERLAIAVNAAYGFEDLARFLDYRLDMDLEDLCGRDVSKREAVRLLLIRASQQGWFDRLLGAFREDTSNQALIEILNGLFDNPSAWCATSVSLVPPWSPVWSIG